jgi:nucleotide-binding universal stress UspA family protein
MLRFQNVLFPVDFSGPCIYTAAYVAGIARKFASRVTLLHSFDAYDPFGYGAASSTKIYRTPIPILWKQREAAMAEFGKPVLDGLTVERVIENGEPGGTIARYVRDHGIDLVVMPTHGYGAFRRLVLGSVTARILHDAHCPVWSTAHCERLEHRCAQCIGRMVCGVDLSGDSMSIVRSACELAQQYRAELRLVNAVGSDMLREDAPFQRFLMDTATEKLAGVQQEAHTQLDTWVKHGDVATVIREAADDWGVGLTIIGRGHANRRLGSLWTHVIAIVRESPCPVLSL